MNYDVDLKSVFVPLAPDVAMHRPEQIVVSSV